MACVHYPGHAMKEDVDDDHHTDLLQILHFTVFVNIYESIYHGCTCDACDPYYCECVKETRESRVPVTFHICYLVYNTEIDKDVQRIIEKWLPVHLDTLVCDINDVYYVSDFKSSHHTSSVPDGAITNNEFLGVASGDLIVDLTGMRYMDGRVHGFSKSINPYD